MLGIPLTLDKMEGPSQCLTFLRQWHVENALIFAKYAGFYSGKTPVCK